MHADATYDNTNAWYRIDLEGEYVITHVKVTSRGGCKTSVGDFYDPPVDTCTSQCYCGKPCRKYTTMYMIDCVVIHFITENISD